MTDWVKASNPTAPITTVEEATAAARASAIAIFIGVVWGVITTVWLVTAGASVMESALAEAAAQNPDAATMPGMAGFMTSFAIGLAVVMVVAQLILGLVQWFKPNVVIPIIFTILIVYGLGSTALGLMMAGDTPTSAMGPMWQIAGGFIVMIIELILHIAGIRGGNALGKLRQAAADPDTF